MRMLDRVLKMTTDELRSIRKACEDRMAAGDWNPNEGIDDGTMDEWFQLVVSELESRDDYGTYFDNHEDDILPPPPAEIIIDR